MFDSRRLHFEGLASCETAARSELQNFWPGGFAFVAEWREERRIS